MGKVDNEIINAALDYDKMHEDLPMTVQGCFIDGILWAQKQPIYAFLYNPMTEESSAQTVSIHRTRKGAEMALEFHKEEKRKEWNKIYPTKEEEPYKFGAFEWWGIVEINVQE